MLTVLVLCLLGLLHSGLGQNIVVTGQCPSVTGVPYFNATSYLGTWYEVARYPQQSQTGQCNRALYTEGDLGRVNVLNSQVVSQTLLTQAGTAQVVSNDGSGQLMVTFVVGGSSNIASLFILDTDYTDYALAYSCRNLANNQMQVASWQLSRNPTLSASGSQAINNFIAGAAYLDPTLYQVTSQSQTDCFYVPVVNPNLEVQFRGSCDMIGAVSAINMTRYLGWWHEIYSYPTGRETGDCISIQYHQQGDIIEFVHTDVLNNAGQVTRGTVEVIGNGILRKRWTADNETVEEDVWVIDTDYDTYTVVLSCQPIADTEYVRVWSSQQSRSQELPQAAVQAIAPLFNQYLFLHDSLFLSVNQSDSACFHYPEPTGEPVVLRGQCDQDIPVQENFNIANYAGVWYQIERYPYPQVPGNATCIGTRYTHNADTGVVGIQNWMTADGNLVVLNGQANVVGSSLSVTYAENARTAYLTILTTDYENYSLAYTCENINPFEKLVVAFKLSRSRTLSAAAASAINTHMATRQELHQSYFIAVAQSDDCRNPNSSFLVKSSLLVIVLSYCISVLM